MKSETEIKSFFESWQLYQKVIQYNYMSHNEIYNWLCNKIKTQDNALGNVLEVGCGDAYMMSKIAKSYSLSQYIGIDLSNQALEYAHKNLSKRASNLILISGEMLAEIKGINGDFSTVIGSYSIHHLIIAEKKEIFENISRLLQPNGRFYLIDIVSYEDESRIDYLNRGILQYYENWIALTYKEKEGVKNHVLSSDYPESFQAWNKIGSAVGLRCISAEYLDKQELFGAMEFVKQA
jgi:ubiquinone/menaquinone biosynthesis C-methylase UbiE